MFQKFFQLFFYFTSKATSWVSANASTFYNCDLWMSMRAFALENNKRTSVQQVLSRWPPDMNSRQHTRTSPHSSVLFNSNYKAGANYSLEIMNLVSGHRNTRHNDDDNISEHYKWWCTRLACIPPPCLSPSSFSSGATTSNASNTWTSEEEWTPRWLLFFSKESSPDPISVFLVTSQMLVCTCVRVFGVRTSVRARACVFGERAQ